MKKWSRWQKVVAVIVAAVLILVGVGAVYLQQSTYPATESAEKLSGQATQEKDYDLYPAAQDNKLNVIFYPGAFVAPESYSNWATQVAKAGYNVYVLHLPLNLAVFAQNAPQSIIEKHPEEKFVLAGHSLGGVIASRFTAEHPKEVAGMIFLASYPDEKGSLKKLDLPVLSLTASNDGVLNQEKYQEAKKYLPAQTEYFEIQGGNHAGFGTYGAQKGDHAATISNKQQQNEISRLMINWLKTLTSSGNS